MDQSTLDIAESKEERRENLKRRILCRAFDAPSRAAKAELIDRITQENRREVPATREEELQALIKNACDGDKELTPEERRIMHNNLQVWIEAQKAVQRENETYKEFLISLGVPEEEIPTNSRAMDRLNILERLRGGLNPVRYRLAVPGLEDILDPPPMRGRGAPKPTMH